MATTPGLSRRTFLTTGLIGLAAISLLGACAPAAPMTKPAEPAKPAEAAKPAADVKPTAALAAVSKPAEPAKPAAAAPAVAQPASSATGKITIVIEAEPNTIVTKDSSTNNGQLVVDNIYDHLTAREDTGANACG